MNIKDKIRLYEENIINSKEKIYKKTTTDKTNVRKKVYEWDNINKLENNIIDSKPTVVNPLVIKPPVIKPPVVKQPVVKQPVVEPPVVKQPVVKQPIVEPPVVKQPVIRKKKKKGLNNNIEDEDEVENSVINM